MNTLEVLVTSNVLSKCMAMQIAGSGLKYGHMKIVRERNGQDGISALFKAKNGSKGVRVTTQNKIIHAVFQHFESKL